MIADIITRGFGTFSAVTKIPTRGFTAGAAAQIWTPQAPASGTWTPGAAAPGTWTPTTPASGIWT